MTLEEKFELLESYLKLKEVLLCLQIERDELRDLKRLSTDMGLPPKGGSVSDPTGNAAVMLAQSIEEVEEIIQDTIYKMRGVRSFINNASGITQKEKLFLLMRFVRGASNLAIGTEMGLPSKSAVQKRIKRIVQRMSPQK